MKIYIETMGCSANLSNAEIMAGLLEDAGYEIVDSEVGADLIIFNTCIVKGPTEKSCIKRINEIKKPLIVTGCFANIPELTKELKHPVLSTYNITQIVETVKDLTSRTERKYEEKLNISKKRKNNLINIVQICEGCQGNCTYCITKLAKGDLFVYPEDKILKEVETSIKQGCKEIWLTAQDTGCYPNLPSLLNKICSLEGDFRVRLGMINPNHVLKFFPELIQSLKNKKMFKFLHIPVQAGNDRILKLMNRFYTVEDFKKIVKELRKEIPDLTISTDVICGFPTETDEEFNHSLELIKETEPNVINISRFWPRGKTKAAEMEQLNGRITKERSQKLTKLFNDIKLKQKQALIGKEFSILIDEKGKDNTMVGKTDNYLAVVVKNAKLGERLKVKIIDARKDCLFAD
ncbi:tRNA (N(6)-L-threonylcarbamoyladenosine(37)-C(2))-methylthiotransferase [Nanoarchaeota archaeon]